MNEDKVKTVSVDGKNIELPAYLKQTLELGDLTIVRVYPSNDELNSYPHNDFNRNVYAYNSSGELVWQIQEAPHGGVGEDKAYMIVKIDKGKLVAGNWIGVDYEVNLEDGTVVPLRKNVRPW